MSTISASRQAERAINCDRDKLRLRVDPIDDRTKFAPDMTVWVSR
jgi:hypothetical protein